jgi:hypothetical protein
MIPMSLWITKYTGPQYGEALHVVAATVTFQYGRRLRLGTDPLGTTFFPGVKHDDCDSFSNSLLWFVHIS